MPLFKNPKGGDYQESPSLALRTRLWGAKISGDPRPCVRRAFWQYRYLRAFSVHTGAPGIKNNWCIYGCLAVSEPHQWWWAL